MILGGVVAGQGQIDVVTLIGDRLDLRGPRRLRELLPRPAPGARVHRQHGPRLQITPDRLEKVEEFFEQHGGKAIFIGRFVGLVRAIAPFLAGSGGMPFRRFLPFDVLGAGLWATTFIMLGYVFWHSLDRVLSLAKRARSGSGSSSA